MSLAPLTSHLLPEQKRLFTVDEYERMGKSGVLTPDERTELIEGEIVRMTPMGSVHAAIVMRLNRLFWSLAEGRFLVTAQTPGKLGVLNEPQPDILLLKPKADDYLSALPTSKDIVLVIEVSDSTIRLDRNVKMPMYAREGVKEAWLIDVKKNRVEVHRKPTKLGYTDVQIYTKSSAVELSQCKGVVISMRDILP